VFIDGGLSNADDGYFAHIVLVWKIFKRNYSGHDCHKLSNFVLNDL